MVEVEPQTRAARVKLVPPRLPRSYVSRPELDRRIDQALDHRLTVVVAGAGFGKSTHVAARALEHGWAWYTADAGDASAATFALGLGAAFGVEGAGDAAALARALEDRIADDVVLVVDDVHELGRRSDSARFLEGLIRYAPPELHFVLCSRAELPFSVARLRGRGDVLDLDPSELAFSTEETVTLLADAVGAQAAELGGPLRDATGGWPAAVQLASVMLASLPPDERAGAVEALAARRGPLFSYLAEDVFGREPPETRRLLRAAAQFDRVSPELCDALGVAGERVLDALARRGLAAESEGWYALHALVRDFVRETWPVPAGESRELHRKAGAWFRAAGQPVEALAALSAAGDAPGIARLLATSVEVVQQGPLHVIVEAGRQLPRELRTGFAGLRVAHAHILRGEFDEAREWLSGLEQAGLVDPGFVSFHLAVLHINKGEPREALDALLRPCDGHWESCHSGMPLAFIAYQLMALGRLDEARRAAERAFELAPGDPDPTPPAEAHMALGVLARIEGDLGAAETHFQVALEIVEGIGNLLATCSALTRLAGLRGEQGRYGEALDLVTRSLELADRIGFSMFQAWTPTVRGAVRLGRGDLDEAAADFESAKAIYERFGSHAVSAALVGLADVHRERGELAQARSAYERALLAVERSSSIEDRPPALAGLARVLVDEDPAEATRLAQEAVAIGIGEDRARAQIAAGWVALRRGHRDRAQEAAEAALAEARRRGGLGLLGEALELAAFVPPALDVRSLEEALAIWQQVGNVLGEARVRLALGHPDAEQTLRRLGVRRSGAGAGLLLMLADDRPAPLAVQTLGRFAVLREGEPVPAAAWQSKKARDLLKLLVARRGRLVPRDELMETLWPDEDPQRTSNRLSVALNVVRSVVGDHVVSDRDGVRLDLSRIAVDVEDFLGRARAGLALHREGRTAEAVTLLEAAEALYGGDFLEEDRYEDWAASLRDEVRAEYLGVLRALASGADGSRYWRRVLAVDPYDEDAHVGLVATLAAAGMHGEARRAYRRYVERMDEIGVEPAPFPR